MHVVRKVFDLLDHGERFRAALLLVAVLVMAALEMISVATVFPFLSVASDPTRIHDSDWLSAIYDFFGFTSTTGFLIALGAATVVALLPAGAVPRSLEPAAVSRAVALGLPAR